MLYIQKSLKSVNSWGSSWLVNQPPPNVPPAGIRPYWGLINPLVSLRKTGFEPLNYFVSGGSPVNSCQLSWPCLCVHHPQWNHPQIHKNLQGFCVVFQIPLPHVVARFTDLLRLAVWLLWFQKAECAAFDSHVTIRSQFLRNPGSTHQLRLVLYPINDLQVYPTWLFGSSSMHSNKKHRGH